MKFALIASFALAKIYFQETFDNGMDRWVISDSNKGKWKISPGNFYGDKQVAQGLKTTQDAKFYAISASFDEDFNHKDKDFVVQFSVKFEQHIDCGGGYMKIMPPDFNPKNFNGDAVYNIMFGPDICGTDQKTHVILRYNNENHLITKSIQPKSDQLTHLYTLVIKPNQTYTVYIDQEDVANGTLIDDWNILAPKKIKDPKVTKPEDWVLEPMMDDPNDEKPEDWVSGPLFILDPNAVKPDDWDQEEDGDWTPPEIPNPDFKGEWQRKKIPNPNYKGEWVHPEIDNPDYKNDTEIYAYTSGFLGFDLWQVKSGTIFDNIIVTDSLEEAQKFAEETFVKYKADEKSAKEVIDKEQEEKLKLENEKFLKEQEEKRKQEEERLAKEQAEKLKQKKLSEEEEEEEEDEHPEL